MRQTSSITFWFSTVLRRACPSFSHAPREPCSPTPDQDHVRGQRPLEAPAFSDSWHDLADVHVYTCEYIYIYTLYIHSTIIHMHIYIPTVSPVFWNKISTEFPCDENGHDFWWDVTHFSETSGSLWVKPIMCSYIDHHLSNPPNVKHPPETIV